MMRCKLPISAGINHITCHNGGSRESPATGSAGTDLQIPPVSQDLTSLRPLPLGIGLGREHKTPTHPCPLHLCCPTPHRHSAGEALHLLGESGVRVVTFALSVFLSSLSLSLSSLSLSLSRARSLFCAVQDAQTRHNFHSTSTEWSKGERKSAAATSCAWVCRAYAGHHASAASFFCYFTSHFPPLL